MIFVTQEFVLFFLCALPLCWITRTNKFAHTLTLVASNLFFYFYSGIRGGCILIGIATLSYAIAYCIYHAKKRGARIVLLWIGVCLFLLTLSIFKYFEMIVLIIHSTLNFIGFYWNTSLLLEYDIAYVAGLSFFSFQAISYLADIYKEKIKHPYSYIEVLAYISFFPTVFSGPIMRADVFVNQLEKPTVNQLAVREGFALILSGLFKKVVISSYLSEHLVKEVFAGPETYSSLAVLIGVLGYGMQIYCDFSGYSDLAIGIGRLMGYDIAKNFNSPYKSYNLSEFWRRWHISLSQWLRDYLYIPLGGSRKGNVYLNLILTMFLGGLWHGNTPTFLIWGFFHGIGLSIQHAFTRATRNIGQTFFNSFFWHIISWAMTFVFVHIMWIFFCSENIDQACEIIERIVACDTDGKGFHLFALIAIIITMGLQYFGHYPYRTYVWISNKLPWPLLGVLTAGVATLFMAMGPSGVLPFIYFGF